MLLYTPDKLFYSASHGEGEASIGAGSDRQTPISPSGAYTLIKKRQQNRGVYLHDHDVDQKYIPRDVLVRLLLLRSFVPILYLGTVQYLDTLWPFLL